jgi:hypothetical protein
MALQHDPGAALFALGSAADALLLSAPPQAERASARELAAWALTEEARPLLTLHAGRAVPGVEVAAAPLPAPLRAFLDTLVGQG